MNNNTMLRTQISLPQTMHRKLNRLAQERGQSMAEIMRSAVEKELETVMNFRSRTA